MPDFKFKSDFPIASVIDAAGRNAQLQQQAQESGRRQLVEGLQSIGQIGASLYETKKRVAQSLALGRQFGISDEESRSMTPEQVLEVGKANSPISVPYRDKDGSIKVLSVPRGSKGLAPVGTAGLPQQTQYVDEATNAPLLLDKTTGTLIPSKSAPGIKPVLKKGDESAVTDPTVLSNQIPNIKVMFDAYRTSKSPRLQSTQAGRLMNPAGKQAENSLKLAAFSFGGKNLTGQEKEVVFGALFPSWTDDEQSRAAKEQLLTDYTAGKIDLLEAANLLGPAGSKLRQLLAKRQSNVTAANQPAQVQAAPVPATPAPSPDLAHLSTSELMDLRKKMTAHKEKKSGS